MQKYDEMARTLQKIDAIREQQEQVFKMAKYYAVSEETIKTLLEEICFEVSQIMKCQRVSIWLFNEDRTRLHSQNTYNQDTKEHTIDSDFCIEDFPFYFEEIQSQRTLAADDIGSCPATKEIAEKYFDAPNQFASLLDACIILGSGIGGLLCCESRERREWNSFDRMVVSSMADMLSFLFDRLSRLDFEKNLHRLAFIDPLTEMANYNAFLAEAEIRIAEAEQDQKGVFVYITIDQFIDIHSVLGPELADDIIRVVAERFLLHFEKPYHIARIAFDHFVMFAPYDKGETEFKRKMEKLIDKLREPILVASQEVYLTFSYGVAYYPKDVLTPIEGVQAARFALETSKRKTSRKSVGIYNADTHQHMKQTMMSEMNLRKGLDMNEFKLFYQPQVLCDTGEVIGFEALIRWQHPELGLIYPADFIELAESTGFIISIGEWVVRQALGQLKQLKELGLHHVTISVNLSPRHFLQHNLPAYLDKCIQESQINPRNLLLEITESVAMERHEIVQQRIHQLAEKGFSIAIDDFGTGYSAFIYLQTFPIRELKIDRSFIMNISHNDKSRAIVKAIIQLGKTLKIRTVAEGIETQEQWDILKSKGCDELQGFYFARPLNEADMQSLLARLTAKPQLSLPVFKV